MILLLSTYVTNTRLGHSKNIFPNRYSRYDIFKYTLYSYKKLPLTNLYLFIKLDDEFIDQKKELTEYIFKLFKHIEKDKIEIIFDRYTSQNQWIPFITNLKNKHPDELVWFTQNDDHVYIDFNNEILEEGLKLLKNEKVKFKTIAFSHFPEMLKLSGKYENPELVGNYVKFYTNLIDSIQIFNIDFLYHIFCNLKWNCDNFRLDTVLINLINNAIPQYDYFFKQIIFVPLRELVRHFDGYAHVNIYDDCPKLVLPHNTFYYDKNTITRKMIAPHPTSQWAHNNNFNIPQEWINIGIKLHEGINSYTL